VVEPIITEVAIAAVSAAAGAASQIPRIQNLEKELKLAKSALTEVSWSKFCFDK
jgi:hypothetical protein